MKNIFGINKTENKNNNRLDGEVFHTNSTTPVLKEDIEKCDNLYKNYLKQTSLPLWLRVIKILSIVITGLTLYIISLDLSDRSLREEYAYAPELFFISAILFTVWLTLYLIEKKKKNKYNESNYIQDFENHSKELLHIPNDAVAMEILLIHYKIKKRKGIDLLDVFYIKNFNVYVNVKDGALHMTDIYSEWSIPLESITGIKKINKKICIPEWLKKIPYNKGVYKKYKITMNGLGFLFFKPYYALCITWQDESYELFIPPYEVDMLSALIGVNYDGVD